MTRLFIVFILLCVPCLGRAARTTLAEKGEARLSIVVSSQASDLIRQNATELADLLQQISGAEFKIQTGDGSSGLVLGLPQNLPGLPLNAAFGKSPFERDHYRLKSTDTGLYLVGATPTAVAFAVSDLLYQLGYRYYFPSDNWEIIPRKKDLSIAVDRLEKPDFFNRSGPRGGMRINLQPWLQDKWAKWRLRNRTAESFKLNTGHSYIGIIRRNQKEFDQHPEYLALRDGERGGWKFCISNPQLRALVVRDAIAQFKADPARDSVSLDPSDGGGWCECESCADMGSVSDRVVILANQAAKAVNALGLGDKYIGIYAYSDYSPPPTVNVHPKVIPSMATAFIKGDQTFESMLEGWSRKTGMIGIREYYGLPVWHQSMPGSGKASRPLPLAQTIREQHAAGARFMNAESDNAWGACGLGYYLASRLLWDVYTPVRPTIDDFLHNSFGPAEKPMREFYDFISSGPLHSDHMIGTMYRKLSAARELADDPAIRRRIDDLVLYTRYAELYRQASDQKGFDRVVNFLWRSRTSSMADAIGMFSYLNRNARKSNTVTWIPGQPESRSQPPERLRKRGDEPFTEKEIRVFVEEGIRNHNVLDFSPLGFSDDLVPTQSVLQLPEVPSLGKTFFGGSEGSTITRGELHNYTWIDNPPREIRLKVMTGVIYNNRGPATIDFAWRGALDVEKVDFHVLHTVEVPEDKKWHEVRFIAKREGLYRITWRERMTGTRVQWPADLPRTVLTSEGSPKQVSGRHSWYFYVPKGTKVIGAYDRSGAGALFNADGKQVVDFKTTPDDFISIKVPENQSGRLWSIRALGGRFRLLNVPPYGSAVETHLLLPRELLTEQARER